MPLLVTCSVQLTCADRGEVNRALFCCVPFVPIAWNNKKTLLIGSSCCIHSAFTRSHYLISLCFNQRKWRNKQIYQAWTIFLSKKKVSNSTFTTIEAIIRWCIRSIRKERISPNELFHFISFLAVSFDSPDVDHDFQHAMLSGVNPRRLQYPSLGCIRANRSNWTSYYGF